ncbi:hypothetical protein QTP88_007785 [Uroleucon formosanum]
MSQIEEIHDLTKSDDNEEITSSQSLNRLNYKQGVSGIGESSNIIRIPIPLKRRPIGYDEYPNFERQYIQNINIPTTTKTEGDNDGAGQNQDDNYHFLMSLLPYLREVPKNRKMAIRHKLQRVFVEEQERKSAGKNINATHLNLNNYPMPFSNKIMTYPFNQPQQIPNVPPPPYPYQQDVAYKYVPLATSATASGPMPNARASTSTLLGNLLTKQGPILPEYPVSSGHQQYYNAKANNNANTNNSSFGYSATTVDNNNANNNTNSSFGYNATTVDNNNASNNNSSIGYNATTMNNNNAKNNNDSSFGYNATTVDNNNASNNSSFGYNATTVDNNNSSFLNNITVVDNDNATFTYQSGVTGELQTFTYLQ